MTKEEALNYLDRIEKYYKNGNGRWNDLYHYFSNQLKEVSDKELVKFVLDRIYMIPHEDTWQLRQSLVVNLITKLSINEATEYLTPDKNVEFLLSKANLVKILKHFGNVEFSNRFYFSKSDDIRQYVEFDKSLRSDGKEGYNCNANLILAQAKDSKDKKDSIESFLTPENVLKYKLNQSFPGIENGLTLLLSELDTEDREKYLFDSQDDFDFSMANVIKPYGAEAIIDYLKLENAKKYGLLGKDINYLINSLSEDERKKYLLPNQTDNRFGWRNIFYHETNSEKVKRIITDMYENNHSVFTDYSDLLGDEKLLEFANEEMVSYLSLFSEGNEFSKLDSIRKKLVLKLVSYFMRENQTDEWTLVFEQVMSNICLSSCKILIDKIDEEELDAFTDDDLSFLLNIILNNNKYKLKDIKDKDAYLATLEENKKRNNNYYRYLDDNFEEETEEDFDDFECSYGATVNDLIACILECKYGISYKDAISLFNSFGADIDYIDNDDLKAFIKTIGFLLKFQEQYLNSNDGNVISSELFEKIQNYYGDEHSYVPFGDENMMNAGGVVDDRFKNIIENVKPIPNIEQVNFLQIEKMLRKEYMKLYKKTLFSIENAEVADEENRIYELPVDDNGFVKKFNCIVTSLAAFYHNDVTIENYYDFWNRPEVKSLHFCGSYIGRNMNSTARVSHLCFGFDPNLPEDSLLKSNSEDIGSHNDKIHSTSNKNEEYFYPENQLINTSRGGGADRGYRNEMDIRRIVNNERIQPSYIVVFRTDDKISNMDEALRARKEFLEHGIDLPILIIDREECLTAEAYEIAGMILEYEKNPNDKLKKQIQQKLDTNDKTITYIEEHEGVNYREDFKEWIAGYVAEITNQPDDKKSVLQKLKNQEFYTPEDRISEFLSKKKMFTSKEIAKTVGGLLNVGDACNYVLEDDMKGSIDENDKMQ